MQIERKLVAIGTQALPALYGAMRLLGVRTFGQTWAETQKRVTLQAVAQLSRHDLRKETEERWRKLATMVGASEQVKNLPKKRSDAIVMVKLVPVVAPTPNRTFVPKERIGSMADALRAAGF